ncbi:MAG: ATP-binding cassette domain-containing protein [Patescibacteria group bacterium]
MPIIESKNLTKSFVKKRFNPSDVFHMQREEKVAVNKLSIEIEEGEFIGFLGPNGAGKTTYLKMLSGIIYPTSGEAKVLGFTPWEKDYRFLGQIAIVMGQKNQLWWDLPAIDSFHLLKDIYSISENDFKKNLDDMIEILGMKEVINRRLRNMSLGERMKCELAASFLHNPKVIFLDEPTIGLDVVSSQAIRKFLININRERKCTMILTSHYMGDIEEMCKRVVIINKGEKIYDGELSKLKEKYAPEKKIQIYLKDVAEKEKFAKMSGKKNLEDNLGTIRASKSELGSIVKDVFSTFDIENITISDPDTEEVITKIFGENR